MQNAHYVAFLSGVLSPGTEATISKRRSHDALAVDGANINGRCLCVMV